MAGLTVEVTELPEELAGTRPALPNEAWVWSDPEGNRWNDYNPLRLILHDSEDRPWRLPRRWVESPASPDIEQPDSSYAVEEPLEFRETLHLPSYWDLLEINLPEPEAARAAGRTTQILVSLAPDAPVKVQWYDSRGTAWRIPHDWRRRRVRLPDQEALIEQGVPMDVAMQFSNRIVSVNYHPGSLCCLPDQYRFRDSCGDRRTVNVRDCLLLGYGDAEEHLA